MMTAGALVLEIRSALEQAGLYNQNELNVLFETALGSRPGALTVDQVVDEEHEERLRKVLARRLGGEPLQYIAGRWPFLDFELEVGPGVLIPRPETEQLAEWGIRLLPQSPAPCISGSAMPSFFPPFAAFSRLFSFQHTTNAPPAPALRRENPPPGPRPTPTSLNSVERTRRGARPLRPFPRGPRNRPPRLTARLGGFGGRGQRVCAAAARGAIPLHHRTLPSAKMGGV